MAQSATRRDAKAGVTTISTVINVLAVLALLATLYAVWSLSHRTGQLEKALEVAKARESDLEHKLQETGALAADMRRISEDERQRAEAALDSVRETEMALTQAELDRSLALEEADRQRLEAERIRRTRDRELDRMKEILGLIVETERTPMGLVMRLGEQSFEFDFDKADLRAKNREILSRIAGVLLASTGYRLYVDGHTDNQGDARYNKQLSDKRAKAVRDYLVQAGIPDEIINSQGYGEKNPRDPNTTKDGRQKNRRVEIGLVDTIIDYEGVVENPVGEGASPSR